MRVRTQNFPSKPSLIRVNGKRRLNSRKRPTPKTRRVIPGRIHHVSTFAFVALPESVTKKLTPSERVALLAWFRKERSQVVMDHKGHHFNVTLRWTVLIDRKDKPTEQPPAVGKPQSPTGRT